MVRGRTVRATRLILLSVAAILGLAVSALIADSPVPGAEPPVAAEERSPITLGGILDRLRGGGGSTDHLVWTSGGLPDGFASVLAGDDDVRAISVTWGDRVDLTGAWDTDGDALESLDPGWTIPLEGFAVEPVALARFVPRDVRRVITGLDDGEAVLSETSAEVRGAGVGAELGFGDERVTVVGVVPDRYVGAAEVVVDLATGERLGIGQERFLLVRHDLDHDELVGRVREALPDGEPVRVTPVEDLEQVRQGSGVLPQSHVKQRFGEFALRDVGRRGFEQDPDWVAENIRTERVPLLGRITCHKDYFPAVRGALQELDDRGLGHLVTVRDYGGCWTPRYSGARRSISRHAWGITADFNISRNPYGAEPDQDPRLVEIMESWGMNWGGTWLVPDAMHFEHVEFPDR